jgi:hypothetical protein
MDRPVINSARLTFRHRRFAERNQSIFIITSPSAAITFRKKNFTSREIGLIPVRPSAATDGGLLAEFNYRETTGLETIPPVSGPVCFSTGPVDYTPAYRSTLNPEAEI